MWGTMGELLGARRCLEGEPSPLRHTQALAVGSKGPAQQ